MINRKISKSISQYSNTPIHNIEPMEGYGSTPFVLDYKRRNAYIFELVYKLMLMLIKINI